MVYRFKLISEETSNFFREIEIDSEADFMQLRNAILDSVGYTKDGLDVFYICDEDWNRQQQVLIEDFGSASDEDVWIMSETPISELVEDKGQHLAFVFDNLSERAFFMALVRIDYDRSISEPLCTTKEGNPPKQSLELEEVNERTDKRSKSAIDDFEIDSLYGDSEFNDDEILDGFDSIDDLDI